MAKICPICHRKVVYLECIDCEDSAMCRNIDNQQKIKENRLRVIIAGGRDFDNYPLLKEKMDLYLQNYKNIVIISGHARGADSLGERYAKEKGFPLEQYPAQWDIYNKQAGPIRNIKMAENADALVAFWDGKSRGTKHIIQTAKEKGLQVRVVYY